MYVWTYVYRPFGMGGDVNQPTRCEVDTPAERHDLGKGFFGYVLTSPGGKTLVVEERSGGVVGDSLAQVRKDIEEGDAAEMEKQVSRATHELKRSRMVEATVFWVLYDRATK